MAKQVKQNPDKPCKICIHSEAILNEHISNDGIPILSKCKFKKYLTLLSTDSCTNFKPKKLI